MGSAITCPELTSSWNNNSVRAATATLRLQGLPISRGAFLITNVSSRCREMPLTDTGLPTADPRWIFPLTEWWNGRDDMSLSRSRVIPSFLWWQFVSWQSASWHINRANYSPTA